VKQKFITLIVFSVGFFCIFSGCADSRDADFEVVTSYEVVGGWHSAAALDGELNKLSYFSDGKIQDETQYSVQLLKVRYRTVYKGAAITASGVVLVPTSGKGPFPVVSYHHGTKFYDGEIPSMSTAFNLEKEVGWAYVMASAGFVCSVPDYLGFNESYQILHPYLLEEPTGIVPLDMLRATLELCEYINVKTTNRIFLTGYSEGGYATLVVQKRIQEQHAGEFSLAASSAGAGPYDLLTTARVLSKQATNVVPAYAPFLFLAYKEYFGWGRATSSVFQSPYATRIDGGLFDGSHSVEQINAQLAVAPTNLYQEAFLSSINNGGELDFKNALQTNSIYSGWAPNAPTRLYHGDVDLTVPYTNSLIASNAFQASGGNFTMHTLTGKNHLSGAPFFLKETLLWFLSL